MALYMWAYRRHRWLKYLEYYGLLKNPQVSVGWDERPSHVCFKYSYFAPCHR